MLRLLPSNRGLAAEEAFRRAILASKFLAAYGSFILCIPYTLELPFMELAKPVLLVATLWLMVYNVVNLEKSKYTPMRSLWRSTDRF
jgi:hypothetical protein